MNTFTIYKLIKDRLKEIAPGFYYMGQYLKGKDNTSYVVPAIYIELPKYLPTTFERKVKVAKAAQIKIHLVTNAPYKNHDNVVQDSAIQEHQTKLNAIDKLMTGCVLKDAEERLISQQFIPVGTNAGNFEGLKVYSVLTYSVTLYSHHLL